jgi:hypothetical protein
MCGEPIILWNRPCVHLLLFQHTPQLSLTVFVTQYLLQGAHLFTLASGCKHMYIYICIHICVYMYTYIDIHKWYCKLASGCKHMYKYICVHIYVYMYTYIHKWCAKLASRWQQEGPNPSPWIYIYIYIYTHMHMYICVHIHIYIHIFIHTQIYTPDISRSL